MRTPLSILLPGTAAAFAAATPARAAAAQAGAAACTRVVPGAIGAGADFLLGGSRTPGGYPFAPVVGEPLPDGVQAVPSGTTGIARLQAREGHAHIKP
ncbi:MAG: hypothetical protein ABFC67_11000 [Mizugakiibacter sp.]|uniref:hypothetical protein n=1 Tax=Mizugakiibacter sp. TaxID=1972610 RepID=UPI0031BCE10F|nr:hypothetical protein [Xanthomonadaceae bacterium]